MMGCPAQRVTSGEATEAICALRRKFCHVKHVGVHVITAKAGLAGFTKGAALDLAPSNITVDCVVPGLIGTHRGATSPANPHHHANRPMPLGRRGTPEEVAALVRYLCGPHARYITGQSLHVNGGAFMP
jgi:3-oxoacyl-[acyl-carrier protein] reductase